MESKFSSKDSEYPRDLANQHWGYIQSLLEAHRENMNTIMKIKFHYISAFEHGYKHAIQDNLLSGKK